MSDPLQQNIQQDVAAIMGGMGNYGNTTAFPQLASLAANQSLFDNTSMPFQGNQGGNQNSNAGDPSSTDPQQQQSPLAQFASLIQNAQNNGQQQADPSTAGPSGPRPGQPAPGQPSIEPWGQPQPGSVKQPPPGYLPVSMKPDVPGGSPPQQGPSPAQQAGADGGGGRMPQMGPAPQGIGGVGALGGAAGMPLPALIQMLMQQMMARRRMMRGGPFSQANYLMGAGRYPTRAPFSPQSERGFWNQNRGSNYSGVPPGPNYMQRLHQGQYPPVESQMQPIQTPGGMLRVNPQAASDFQGFMGDLARAGFPMERQWGSYNRRRMRWSNNWSSHAWGTAVDMNDMEGPMSPAMQRWMMQNPGLFQQIMNRWNMSQPLPGKDPNHIEWTGPGNQNPPGTDRTGYADPNQTTNPDATGPSDPSQWRMQYPLQRGQLDPNGNWSTPPLQRGPLNPNNYPLQLMPNPARPAPPNYMQAPAEPDDSGYDPNANIG